MGFFDKLKETLGFDKLKEGLTKTRSAFTDKIEQIITGYRKIDEELLEEIEEAMIQADIGVHTTTRIIGEVRKTVKKEQIESPQALYEVLAQKVADMLGHEIKPLNRAAEGPTVILVVGVNGVGKTTTIGKLAFHMKQAGDKVLLAAGDTFRAAAIDQLEIWGERVGAEVIKQAEGSDPAAVVFDAVQAAKARRADVLIIDTAGRLHNKTNLMEELRKITRVISREIGGAPHEVLLVLDATTGQNAIAQAKIFQEVAGVTGVALTKLDGTAKGGVVVAISAELAMPVKIIGVGEGMNDLRLFAPEDFASALFNRDKE
ncbi:MAG TPA: signal recognition particle-docking protein FtsY [Negativicutes bacterium]|nr:signal recognition particle-docking protein FtsY [Negativicutes bacterium]